MPTELTQAIVTGYTDYKDNDRMLTLFSPQRGRIDCKARNCRKPTSPLLSCTQPFVFGEFELFINNDRVTVNACDVRETFYPLREDWDRLAHGTYLLELCLGAVQPEQENERLFLLLLRSLAHLAYGDAQPRRVTAVFLMGIVSLMGFRPSVGRCQRCGRPLDPGQKAAGFLSQEAGGVLCTACMPPEAEPLTGTELWYLQGIMRRGLDSLEEPAECTDRVFAGLRALAESRLDVQPRTGRML